MKISPISMLKFMFIFGAIVDGAIAISWFLIASGMRIPNILNGFVGEGSDYQFAMYIAAMFMMGWTALLAWGAVRPLERRGLLVITASLLFLSVIIELLFFGSVVQGAGFVFGLVKRMFLGAMAASIFFYSTTKD